LSGVTSLTAALQNFVKDLQDSWDDSYDDMRGLLDSSVVATTQAAQTLQTVNAKAGPFTDAVAGIAADVHDATHNLDVRYFHPPKVGFWGRVKQIFMDVQAIFIAALRGGVF
jgi:hypothetical protein